MIKEIAFTASRVTDMVRAQEFYEGLLGLTPTTNYQDAWVEYEIDGGAFALPTMSPVCWTALVTDPDGHSVAVHQRKASAS